MPNQRLHSTIIGDKIVDLIDQNLSSSLGLKVVTFGALEFFPALENLQDNVPAVFVKPSPATNLERITIAQTYEITYNFRIVYVRLFGPNEEITRRKTEQGDSIGELFIDAVNLNGLALPNGQVTRTFLPSIEWEPPEDTMVAQINADMTAAAFNFNVKTNTRK